MRYELPIDPPEDEVLGYDWQGGELYGYEEGFLIDGSFVREEDSAEYLKEKYPLVTIEDTL